MNDSVEVDDAVIDAADSVKENADAQAEAARAAAARATTDAAIAAAALAEANAAETIQNNEGKLEWLRQHVTQTDTSLKEQKQSLDSLASSIPALMEAERTKTLEAVSGLLTPLLSRQEPTNNEEIIDPNKESADEDARREAEKKKQKPKLGPKYRDNWT